MTQVQKIKPSQTLDRLSQDVTRVMRQEAALLGIAQQAKVDMATLAVEIAECDLLLNRKDDVLRQLGLLQQQAQAKNKGVFEEILTSLIHEIMPHKAGDQIILSSTLRHNLAALDVDIMSNGHLENVSRDKGGSISNIVAMGMRFVVLARQPNRRVLFLDEADCHLREEYIPAFAAVMQQLAHKLGIQVVYISHHPAAFFQGFGRIIEIYKQDGQNHSQILSDEQAPDDHEYPENAFRYIRLRDFGPHENVLVELGGGLNIITGDNDLGKSKFITAVGELLTNDGQEARIRHGRPYFEIEIGLEMGMSLIWKYKRSGSQKTLLELKDNQGQVIESSTLGSGKTPEWLHTYLAMGLVNDKNIHVHHQDEPKYLLSSHYSSIDRAKMLPLGRESRDVLRMIQIFNQQVTDARAKKRGFDLQLLKVKNLLQALGPLLDNDLDQADLEAQLKTLQEQCTKSDKILASGSAYAEVSRKRLALEDCMAEVERVVLAPVELSRSGDMKSLLARIEKTSESIGALKELQYLDKCPTAPMIRDVGVMLKLGKKIKVTQDLIAALEPVASIDTCEIPSLPDRSLISTAIEKFEALAQLRQKCERNLVSCQHQGKTILSQKNALIESLGGTCPTCQQSMTGAHNHA